MSVRFLSFSSGSSGNCYYIGSAESSILIDAGVSVRRLKSCMSSSGLSMDDVDAVLVTHDHLDHIRHLGALVGRYNKPVYTVPGLCSALKRHTFTAGIVDPYLKQCGYYEYTGFKDVRFRPLRVPHDATETVGYHIESGGESITVLTDLGRVTDEAAEFARLSSHLVIESNYDMDMLMRGPYTAALKARIMGENGHLSNDDCASFLRRVYHEGLKHIFLCHISDNNNTKETAYECSAAALRSVGVEPGRDVMLYPLPRRGASNLVTL